MSAIQAAISELEALRMEIDQVISGLRGLCERGVVTAIGPVVDRGRVAAALKALAPASVEEPVRRPGAKALPPGSRLDLVYQAVRKDGPTSAVAIAARLGIPREGVSVSLNTLKVRGMVTLTGRSTTAQWSIVARRPAETASTNELEVVWSGTKERLGQAPGLAAARETRAR
jgi:hypothetical protein